MGTHPGHGMIVNYRKREKRSKIGTFYEVDWKEGYITLYSLRYFPKLGKVYPNKAQNPYTEKFYLMYKIEPELLEVIIAECKAHLIMGQLVEEAVVIEKPKVKMGHLEVLGNRWYTEQELMARFKYDFAYYIKQGMKIEER
jgi:hypothetical protein